MRIRSLAVLLSGFLVACGADAIWIGRAPDAAGPSSRPHPRPDAGVTRRDAPPAVPPSDAASGGTAGSPGLAPGGGAGSRDGGAPSARDCRDDYPEVPWTRTGRNECSKCYGCPAEGFLPGVAFVTCKVGDRCFRFATVDNCNYDLCARGSCTLPAHDPAAYCRKDGRNYTYFICHVDGQRFEFQTVDGTHYHDTVEQPDPIGDVAGGLPIPGGCTDHSG